LLIDLKDDKAARAVVFGLLREMEREHQESDKNARHQLKRLVKMV
jgi:hypothetical protein